MISKGYLRTMKTFQVNNGVWKLRLCDSEGILMYGMTLFGITENQCGNAWRNFKEGSIPTYWIGVFAAF